MPGITPIIRELTIPVIHFLIEPSALLTDLGFRDDVDLCGLRDGIELKFSIEIPTKDMLAWRTVADVSETVEWYLGVVA